MQKRAVRERPDVLSEKKELRVRYQTIRHAEAGVADERVWEKMLSNLEKIPSFSSAESVLIYWSKEEEAPTHEMIGHLLGARRKVALPCSAPGSRTLGIFFIRSPDELVRGAFGVMEPHPDVCEKADPQDIDIIVVPGVAFDAQGHRLGHGGGFYDRFLHAEAGAAPKIGLCFDGQIAPEPLPHEAHDVKMDFVVSEKRVLKI